MKSEAARRARRGEAETKGEEKVTAGKKWRNEIKDREIEKRVQDGRCFLSDQRNVLTGEKNGS